MNPQLFKRVLTGVLGGLIFVRVLFIPSHGPWIIAALLTIAFLLEFNGLLLSGPARRFRGGLNLASGAALFTVLATQGSWYWVGWVGIVLGFSYLLLAHSLDSSLWSGLWSQFMGSVFSIFYSVGLLSFLPSLAGSQNGVFWCCVLLIINWGGDTFAYFVGRRWGKTKLTPLSPKKTWEGAWAGLLGSMLLSVVALYVFRQNSTIINVTVVDVLGVTALGAVFAQSGDIFESFMKRVIGVKDSSGILPGHGGFLDRFDGFVWSLPVLFGCIQSFGL